ncbi:MAG: cytochrome c [Chloroflexi bacterium]|nr:cytochrome c [Chloroflexota bacterium]
MNSRYMLITLAGLLILVIALPLYAWMEPARMEKAQQALREANAIDAALIYVEHCAACHGENGEGGSGPALNSLQILTNHDDEAIRNAIVYGPPRTNSIMPAFGDRLTSTEVDALVQYIRSWEATAIWVENPRGTAQGGGPPWLRTAPDTNASGRDQGQGGGPPEGRGWRRFNAPQQPLQQNAALHFTGEVVQVTNNRLTFRDETGAERDAMLGPPWWWSENGIELLTGDPIELEGFESPDHMEVNWLENLRTGQRIELRTPDGAPVWTRPDG